MCIKRNGRVVPEKISYTDNSFDGFNAIEKKAHVVGDGYTVFYGAFIGYQLGICDAREALIMHFAGYSYRGSHFWGAENWFMFPS